jgi:hypothetical protein
MGFVNADLGEIVLESKQEVKLLFKFLSYREPVAIKEDNRNETVDYLSELSQRSINIEIMDGDYKAMQRIQIDVQPKWMLCDQIFRYFETESAKSYIQIPNFLEN